jgi:hypothetical protein
MALALAQVPEVKRRQRVRHGDSNQRSLDAAPQRTARQQGRHWTLQSREINLFGFCPHPVKFSGSKFHRFRDPALTIRHATT